MQKKCLDYNLGQNDEMLGRQEIQEWYNFEIMCYKKEIFLAKVDVWMITKF